MADLSNQFMEKVAGAISSSAPAKQAALISGLQNVLSPDQQSQLLDYFKGIQSGTVDSAADPLTIPTDFSVGSTSGSSQIGYRDPAEFGLSTDPLSPSSGSTGSLDLNKAFDDLMAQTISVESDYLQGKIPADVAEQIQIASGEKSLAGGLGSGTGSRNLTARDLGLTSLQIQQSGIQMAGQTAQQLETKRQFNITTQASIDEFNKNYSLNVDQFMSQVRQQDLTEAQLYYANQQFNATQALQVNQMITQMVQFSQQMQFMYATTPGVEGTVDTSGLQNDITGVISDLSKLIG